MGIGASITSSNAKDAKKIFKAIDTDGSGTLSIGELEAAVKQYGSDIEAEWSDDFIKECMTKFDANGDGALDVGEFENALAQLSHTKPGKKKKKSQAKGKNSGGGMMSAINNQAKQAELIAHKNG